MLANCSPAGKNADETANTLRFGIKKYYYNASSYANHAKQIKNQPKRNADGQDGILAALEEEIRQYNLIVFLLPNLQVFKKNYQEWRQLLHLEKWRGCMQWLVRLELQQMS